MRFKEAKDKILEDLEVREEYDRLQVMYDIKRSIIKLRLESGLTQKELAERIGTRQSAISRLESGEYNPSIELLHKIACELGKELKVSFI